MGVAEEAGTTTRDFGQCVAQYVVEAPGSRDGRVHEAGCQTPVNPLAVDVDRGKLRRVDAGELEPRERQRREEQQLELGNYVGRVERAVIDGVGQQGVERPGVGTDTDAQCRAEGHRDQHVARGFLRANSGVVREEREERDLDSRVVEHARRGEQQHEPYPMMPLVERCRHDHRLADEAAEKRERRYRCRPDGAQRCRLWHALVQTAQLRTVYLARAVEHRPHGHQQQPLEQDVVEGVRDGAVDRQRGADADAADHEAELVDQAVGQHAPQIVLDDRVEDRETRHDGADVDEQLGAWETACKGVDGDLGGEGAQEDRARGRGLGVGVREPVVQQRKTGLDAKSDEYEPRRHAVEADVVELQAASVADADEHTG